ncbi:DUF6968 family protein [Nitrospirota bacterium]
MNLTSVGTVIATRRLKVSEDRSREIIIDIGMPMPFPDSRDFYCPLHIKGIGSEKIQYTAGIDSVQALLLAIKYISARLSSHNKELGGAMRWEGDEEGDLGFPLDEESY